MSGHREWEPFLLRGIGDGLIVTHWPEAITFHENDLRLAPRHLVEVTVTVRALNSTARYRVTSKRPDGSMFAVRCREGS